MLLVLRILFVGCSLLSVSISAIAATWNWAWAGNDTVRYFFDADTVERNREIVTVWIKTVQTVKPDSQGAWATASRWRFNCSKRTLLSLTSSDYEKDGTFIKSYPNPGRESDVVPDTIGEAMLKIVCQSDFPKNKSNKDYFPLDKNVDVFQATRNYVDYLKSQKDEAPK